MNAILLDSNRRTQTSNVSKYLLTGLVYCGNCGYKMGNMTRGKKLESTNTYTCRSDPALLMRGCGSCRILGAWVDEFVTTAVVSRLQNDAKLIRNLKKPSKNPSDAEHRDLVISLIQSRSKVDEASNMWADGLLSGPEYQNLLKRLKENQASIERRLAAIEASRPVSEILNSADLTKSWADKSLVERRALLRLIIEKIVINKSQTPGRNTFDSRRIDIIWREQF